MDQVVHALETLAHADGPGHRRAMDLQDRLDLVQQFQRLAYLTVHLVDEGDDGCVAQPAHFQELDRLFFHALGGVDHHDGGVHGGQHTVGVFREVLVARGVEQVEYAVAVGELHHRAGHRNAALALDLHPVGGGELAALLGLDRAGHLDGAAEQQQLFGQGRFTRIGVRNDGKGAAFLDVARQGGITGLGRRGRGGFHRGGLADMKQAAILSYFARRTGPMPQHFRAHWPGCAWHRWLGGRHSPRNVQMPSRFI